MLEVGTNVCFPQQNLVIYQQKFVNFFSRVNLTNFVKFFQKNSL